MYAKLLSYLPISGTIEELHFYSDEDSVCVLFEDNNYDEYCGVFGGGFGNKSDLAIKDNIAFIISNGQGYIFNIDNRLILHKTKCDHLVNVISFENEIKFVACSFTNIYIYNSELIWQSNRVSSDGIIFEKVEKDHLYGKIYDFTKWVDFKLNLNSFDYQCTWISK